MGGVPLKSENIKVNFRSFPPVYRREMPSPRGEGGEFRQKENPILELSLESSRDKSGKGFMGEGTQNHMILVL